MDNFFIVLVLLILVIVGLIFYFKKPDFIYNKTFGSIKGQNIKQSSETNSDSRETKTSFFEPINNVRNKVIEDTQQTTANVKEDVYTTIQNSVNGIFGKQSQSNQPTPQSGPAVQIADSSNLPPESSIVIDLGKENNIKLSMFKNTKYYLQFQNTPPNYCLYINNNKFGIDSKKTIVIEFSTSGSYPIKANSCDLNDKNIGELNVQ